MCQVYFRQRGLACVILRTTDVHLAERFGGGNCVGTTEALIRHFSEVNRTE
jgi:hypothetical protein